MLLLIFGCSKWQTPRVLEEPDPLIVSAYTSGVISRESTIRVRFTEDIVDASQVDKELEQSPIIFSPRIKGKAVWTSMRTLEFRPENNLSPDQDYIATVQLFKFMETDEQSKKFDFRFSVMQQSLTIHIDGLHTPSRDVLQNLQLHGKIHTSDVVDDKAIEKILKASQYGELHIEWAHSDDRLEHIFVVSGIVREKKPTPVLLKWNAKPIQVDKRGERSIEIPSLEAFKVVEIRPVQKEEEYVRIRFSDPLKRDQNLKGLIWIDNRSDLSYVIEGNMVKVYSSSRWPDELTINIESGIRNSMGKQLKVGTKTRVVFEAVKPAVRIPGRGVIFPTSQGLAIPIETVNLRGVVVEVMRIYDANIAQFLQVNPLEGKKELRCVGKVVWRKALSIDWTPAKMNQWVRTGLDLTQLVTEHPKGMYRLKVYFKPDQIEYDCPDRAPEQESEIFVIAGEQDEEEAETSSWDYWDWKYNRPDYYKNRKDPCHPGYYIKFHDHDIANYRNVLISDIGLISKKGNTDSILIAATNLKTAQPLSGVKITVLNYQQREIGRGTTGQDGFAEIQITDTPFLVYAEKDNQAGYLKVDKGSALSVSHFDVGGADIKKGIKGFIYGDRGVRRPGDPIYLTFILMDKDNRLPPDHPVQLRLLNPRGQLVDKIIKKESVRGFYHFPLATEPDAPTGNWAVKIAVGGAVFEKTIKIETVMPNRLKIGLDFGPDTKRLNTGDIQADLSASWLHGAPAKNLKAEVSVSFQSVPTRFAKYSDYIFDDPVRVYSTETQSIFEGKLDQEGNTRVRTRVYTENESPGMLAAHFKTRVFEPGGAASTDRVTIPYHPFNRYVVP